MSRRNLWKDAFITAYSSRGRSIHHGGETCNTWQARRQKWGLRPHRFKCNQEAERERKLELGCGYIISKPIPVICNFHLGSKYLYIWTCGGYLLFKTHRMVFTIVLTLGLPLNSLIACFAMNIDGAARFMLVIFVKTGQFLHCGYLVYYVPKIEFILSLEF